MVATLRDEPDVVVGFASLSPYKERAAYRTTVENSVYVSREHGGLGIGTVLMRHVIDVARDSGFHAIVARIEASSEASRACTHRSASNWSASNARSAASSTAGSTWRSCS